MSQEVEEEMFELDWSHPQKTRQPSLLHCTDMAINWKTKSGKTENNMAKDSRKGEKDQWMEELE